MSSITMWPSGMWIDCLKPDPSVILIEDAAHALALACRYNGACAYHYSVGQHSVGVSHLCAPEDALWGLLHDVPEMILSDIPRPLKNTPEFEFYRKLERGWEEAVAVAFNLDKPHVPASVHAADRLMLLAEFNVLKRRHDRNYPPLMDARTPDCVPADWLTEWGTRKAEAEFMVRFAELTK